MEGLWQSTHCSIALRFSPCRLSAGVAIVAGAQANHRAPRGDRRAVHREVENLVVGAVLDRRFRVVPGFRTPVLRRFDADGVCARGIGWNGVREGVGAGAVVAAGGVGRGRGFGDIAVVLTSLPKFT